MTSFFSVLPMSPMSRLAGGLLFAGLALLVSGCDTDTASSEGDSSYHEPFFEYTTKNPLGAYDSLDDSKLPTDQEIAEILNSQGHSRFEFHGNQVLVDGDMLMNRADFLADSPAGNPALAKQAQEWYSRYGRPVVRNKVYAVWISPRVGRAWSEAVRHAMREWRWMAKIQLAEVPQPGMAHIQVDWAYADRNVIAWAEYPRVERNQTVMGRRVGISYSHPPQSAAQTRLCMLHEFGHLLGFAHTNQWGSGTHIAGSLWVDPLSFMSSGQEAGQRVTRSDLEAIRRMYP